MNRYYQMLENIRDQEGEKVLKNVQGGYLVRGGVPFEEAGQAIKYLLALDQNATNDQIRFDKDMCTEIAKVSVRELFYLMYLVQIMVVEEQKKLTSLVAERDVIDAKERKSLEDTVKREVIQDQVLAKIGMVSGILAVKEVIRERQMELMNIAKDYVSYWSFTPTDFERVVKDA